MTHVLVIDAENLSYKHGRTISTLAATSTVKRAYGDWSANALASWKPVLAAEQIEQIQTAHTPTRKNSADIAIAYDLAMLCARLETLSRVYIASNDSDFLPVVERLLAENIEVIGIVDQPIRNNFVSCFPETLNVRETSIIPNDVRDSFLALAVRLLKTHRWITLSQFADESHCYHAGAFDFTVFGYSKFLEFIRDLKLFELRRKSNEYLLRLSRSYRKQHLITA